MYRDESCNQPGRYIYDSQTKNNSQLGPGSYKAKGKNWHKGSKLYFKKFN